MLINHDPFVFVLSSPSGTGKTTIAKALLENDKNIQMSISCTTRNKRKGEVEGKDYFFVDLEKFEQLIFDNSLLEYAEVYGNFYGTPKAKVEELLKNESDVLFDVDWQGANQLKSIMPSNIVSVFILPPSIKELENRLRSRATEDEEKIQSRLAKAKNEISHWASYDYVVVNSKIEEAIDLIKSIINVERLKRSNNSKIVSQLLNYEI